MIFLFSLFQGSSSVYFWPGYYRINDTPKYHNKDFCVNSNFTQGRQAIDKTLRNLELDDSLNFMVVYINFPDPLGHAFGFKSPQVNMIDIILFQNCSVYFADLLGHAFGIIPTEAIMSTRHFTHTFDTI